MPGQQAVLPERPRSAKVISLDSLRLDGYNPLSNCPLSACDMETQRAFLVIEEQL